MNVQAWTFILVGVTFAIYIAVAIWSRAKSTGEFYVAGKHVSPFANGMATAADWMSAASFISMAGIIAFKGMDGSVYLMGWTGGYVLLALLIAPYLRKFGKFTVPDFIGDRYGSQTARIVAVVCAIFISFTYIAGQMRGVGVVFSRFLEVDITLGVIIGMGLVFFYAVLGGMKGITYTQVVQYCVLIIAYTIPAFFLAFMVTGNPIPQIALGSTDESGIGLIAKLDGMLTDLGFDRYTGYNQSMLNVVCITGALMLGTAGLPHVIIRFFTVKRVKDARTSAGWAILFIAILYTTAPAIAIFARTNMLSTVPGVAYDKAPSWVHSWEDSGLITWDDKNSDGIIDYTPIETNELVIDRDIMVLANPEIAGLPDWVAVSHDLVKRVMLPDISEKRELALARIAAAVAVVFAGLLGIWPPDYVAAVVAFAFGLAAASFFPAILMGIFWKRFNAQGAICGMLVGILSTSGYIVYFKFMGGDKESWLLGISPEGIGVVGMMLNFVVSIPIALLTKPPSEEIQLLVKDIRLPESNS